MTIWLEIEGKERRVELTARQATGSVTDWAASLAATLAASSAGCALECLVDGRAVAVDVSVLQPGVMSLVVEGRQYRCVLDGDAAAGLAVVIAGRRHEFTVTDPRSLKARRGGGPGKDGPRPVKAPMPGRVVRVLVAVGDEVAEGQGVVVIEAMKMQNELKSAKAGRVVKVSAEVGETVLQGAVLVVVE
jgi:biotin carboxyl carrier protein